MTQKSAKQRMMSKQGLRAESEDIGGVAEKMLFLFSVIVVEATFAYSCF